MKVTLADLIADAKRWAEQWAAEWDEDGEPVHNYGVIHCMEDDAVDIVQALAECELPERWEQ